MANIISIRMVIKPILKKSIDMDIVGITINQKENIKEEENNDRSIKK